MITFLVTAFLTLGPGHGAGPVTPVNIFSPDGRDPRVVQSQVGAGRPYAPIGQLLTKDEFTLGDGASAKTGRSFSTATLISPCYVLASAHGALPRKGDMSEFQDLLFRAVTPDGTGFAETAAWPVAWGRTRRFADDWVLVHLTRCEGRRLGWVKVSEARLPDLANKPLETAGFPADKDMKRLWRHAGCKVMGFEMALGLLSTDCAAKEGASGSPLLMKGAGGALEMVGMVVQETNPQTEILRAFDRNHATLAVFVPGIWGNIRHFVEEDLRAK